MENVPDYGLVLVTGVTRGLGRALARGFAARGRVVLGCGRDREALASLRDELGPPHDLAAVDVVRDEEVGAWVSALRERHDAPDLVVNNAALINRNAALWEVPVEEFSAVVDVNVKGVFHVIRHVLPWMLERGRGAIVNVSSTWGRSVDAEVAPYCATKWAVEGLTRALSLELPRGIAAASFNPGIVHTDMLTSCFGAHAASYPPPEAWAERAVPFLLEIGPEQNGHALSCP